MLKGLKTYMVLLQCAPFPFQATVKAFSETSAIGKAKYQAKLCGLKTGKVLGIGET